MKRLLGAYGLQHKYTGQSLCAHHGRLYCRRCICALGSIDAALVLPRRWAVWILLAGHSSPCRCCALGIGINSNAYGFSKRADQLAILISRPDDLILTNTAEHPVLLYYLNHYGYAAALEEKTPAEIDADPQKQRALFCNAARTSLGNAPANGALILRPKALVSWNDRII